MSEWDIFVVLDSGRSSETVCFHQTLVFHKMKEIFILIERSPLNSPLPPSHFPPPLFLVGWQRELDQHQRRAVEECDRVLAQVAAGEDGRGMDLSRTSTQCDHSSPAQSSPDSATPPNPAPVSGPASQRRPQKDATSPTALFPPQVRVFALSLSPSNTLYSLLARALQSRRSVCACKCVWVKRLLSNHYYSKQNGGCQSCWA